MKAQPSSIRTLPEQTILSAWHEQLAQAAPGLSQTLVGRQPELLPRFVACYRKLRCMPRRARRHLQRQFCRAGFNPPNSGGRSAPQPHEFGPTISHYERGEDFSFTPSARLPRSLRRQWKRSLAGMALMLVLDQAPALAATINVGGGCSLVNAITAANTDNAIGLCTPGSGADTIVLPANSTRTLTLINNSTPYGPTGLPVVSSVITIAGNRSTITRASSAPDFRILAVSSTGNLAIRQTTLSGGAASGSFPGDRGGGAVNNGKLTLTNSTVSGNSALTFGGGVYNYQSIALTLANTTLSGNSAGVGGGSVSSLAGPVNFINSVISGNSADRYGGGLYVSGGTVSLAGCTISGNSAVGSSLSTGGGGVWNFDGTVSLTNSTISGNTTMGSGGGVAAFDPLTLTNSTVSGNSAGRGGGVYTSEQLTLVRSLVSGNTAATGAEIFNDSSAIVAANNFNLLGHSGLTSAQAIVGFTPGLVDGTATSDGTTPTALASILNPILANNGGLTQTHALVLGSPAVDETNGCPPPATDQRGVPRPQINGAPQCDVGAFELVPPGTVTCNGVPATRVGTPASQTINGTPGPDVINGLAGNDVIQGLAGNDILCGGPGNDRVLGASGDDRLFGGAGIDRLDGEFGFDRCDGGPPATGDRAANCEQVSNVP